ncbi:MAG: homoserine kinase [Ignavibacteriales bacterium]|nr:homoserine kinase [Ignavibacteriales bacterium]
MSKKKVKVFAPATISNLGSGFDVIGIALEKFGDIVVAERSKEYGITFSVKTTEKNIPTGSDNNVAAYVAQLMLDEFKPNYGVKMVLHKQMPIGSGLGSSAASSVASVVAVNALLPKPLQKKDLLRFAVEGERMASRSPHADNAAPSLFGGAVLIRSYFPLDVVQLPVKNKLWWVVARPHIVIRTEDARNILPHLIDLKAAIIQWGNFGGLLAGLLEGNAKLVGKSVEDVIIEPVRKRLIPGFDEVKFAAINAGALGCSISGAGPALFAVTDSEKIGKKIAKAMEETFKKQAKLKCDTFVSKINMKGAIEI